MKQSDQNLSPSWDTRVRGMLLGAAVGDALGWPQEVRGGLVGGQAARARRVPEPKFSDWTRTAGHYERRYRDPVSAGSYSDDMQLMLASARASLTGSDWFHHLSRVELPTWPLYQRGGGGAVLRASASWAEGHAPWVARTTQKAAGIQTKYFAAGANGVAMRVAPHAAVSFGPELYRRVLLDGISTHGHPRALLGGIVYTAAMQGALRLQGTLQFGQLLGMATDGLRQWNSLAPELPAGWLDNEASSRARFGRDSAPTYEALWIHTEFEVEDLLVDASQHLKKGALSNPDAVLSSLGCTDATVNGSGTITAVASLYLASRFASNPIAGLVTAAFLRGGDTDTLASMTGALLGAIHGDEWLETLGETVQDAGYICRIAEALAADYRKSESKVPALSPIKLRREVQDSLLEGVAVVDGPFPDGRRYTVLNLELLDDFKAVRGQIQLDDGQTVIVDRTLSKKDIDVHPHLSSQYLSTTQHYDVPPGKERARGMGGAPVSVVFPTSQLARCAAWYATLLARDIPVIGRQARLDDAIVLVEDNSISAGAGSGFVIELRVDNLVTVLQRIDVHRQSQVDGSDFRLLDPDGRRVRLVSS